MTSFIGAPARVRHNNRFAWLCLVIGLFFWTSHFEVAAQTPSPSPAAAPGSVPTPLTPEAAEAAEAMKRSRRQAENPYRWIKILGDSKRKPETVKLEPVKARTRNEPLSTEASKSESRPSAATSSTLPATDADNASASTPPGPAAGIEPAVTRIAPATTVTPTAPAPAATAKAQEEEADGELKPISTPPPEFPRELRNSVASGKVMVAFTVQKDGTVGEVSAENSTNRRLSKAATDAVSKWKFEPLAAAETYKVEINFNQQ